MMTINTTIIMKMINIIIIIIKRGNSKSIKFVIFARKNNFNTEECWFNGINKSCISNKHIMENYGNPNETKKFKKINYQRK